MIFIFYIKESNNIDEFIVFSFSLPLFLKKLFFYTCKLFNTVLIKENVITLPYLQNDLISSTKIKKIYNKLNKFFIKNDIHTIALSTCLSQNDEFKNYFYSANFDILDGRWIFKFLAFDVLHYIAKTECKSINEYEVSILTNSYNQTIKENIILFAQNVKVLNVITNNINNFKDIASELYKAFGISIKISNNRKKALLRTNVVLNFDFPEEVFNKYSLPPLGTIVNFDSKINITSKLFNGINANFYKISTGSNVLGIFKSDGLIPCFPLEVLYESLYYKMGSFSDVISYFVKDNVSVSGLIGNNGILNVSEFSAKLPNSS
ncbi:MAG: hypothetical protein RSA27_06010 [Oscillospiraceae bacterium]